MKNTVKLGISHLDWILALAVFLTTVAIYIKFYNFRAE